jgi:hypothetical protein
MQITCLEGGPSLVIWDCSVHLIQQVTVTLMPMSAALCPRTITTGNCCHGVEYCCDECNGSCRCSVGGKCHSEEEKVEQALSYTAIKA